MSTRPIRNLCVFAGSKRGTSDAFVCAAKALVEAAAERGLGVVYGGGNVGLMNVLAEAALGQGVYVVGVIPRHLLDKEVAHGGLDELLVVEDMLERKALMAKLSDTFVAIPGGVGTFDEIFEMLTWQQLGVHDKHCGILNVDGYFDPLAALIENARTHGFVSNAHAKFLYFDDDPRRLLSRLLGNR